MNKFSSDAALWAASSQCISKATAALGGGMPMPLLQSIQVELIHHPEEGMRGRWVTVRGKHDE
jgi:hypothetical protein